MSASQAPSRSQGLRLPISAEAYNILAALQAKEATREKMAAHRRGRHGDRKRQISRQPDDADTHWMYDLLRS